MGYVPADVPAMRNMLQRIGVLLGSAKSNIVVYTILTTQAGSTHMMSDIQPLVHWEHSARYIQRLATHWMRTCGELPSSRHG